MKINKVARKSIINQQSLTFTKTKNKDIPYYLLLIWKLFNFEYML